MTTEDLDLVKKAERIELVQFKSHDRLKIFFQKGSPLAKVTLNLRGRIHELPEAMFEVIKEKMS